MRSPRLSNGRRARKTQVIAFRVTQREYLFLHDECEKLGIDIAEYCHAMLFQKATLPKIISILLGENLCEPSRILTKKSLGIPSATPSPQ